MMEQDQAKIIADKILDFTVTHPMALYVHGDPDCDACVLARQYIRALEREEALRSDLEGARLTR